MASILVIGAASLDTLHIQQTVHSTVGGAGLYTALAVHRGGAHATLFAPKPTPLPKKLQSATNQLQWIGPTAAPGDCPRLEIAHHGDGRATLLGASWGSISQLKPEELPDNLASYDAVHIAALPTAQTQLQFLRGCRERGASCISVGTYAKVAMEESETVHALIDAADLFFMNENEAALLFGSLDQVQPKENQTIFVTRDKDGALIYIEDQCITVSGAPVAEVDPTGAGDTFCGITVAQLAQGIDVETAASRACEAAAQTVQEIGPSRLLAAG